MVLASKSLSGIFFWEIITVESLPQTPMEVKLEELIALKAYSTWYKRPSGEKMVMCLSKPAAPGGC